MAIQVGVPGFSVHIERTSPSLQRLHPVRGLGADLEFRGGGGASVQEGFRRSVQEGSVLAGDSRGEGAVVPGVVPEDELAVESLFRGLTGDGRGEENFMRGGPSPWAWGGPRGRGALPPRLFLAGFAGEDPPFCGGGGKSGEWS